MSSVNRTTAALAVIEFALAVLAVHLVPWVQFAVVVPESAQGPLMWVRSAVFGAFVVIGLMAMGLYQVRQRLSGSATLVRVLSGAVLAAVGLALTYYVIPTLELGRGWLALSFVFLLAFLAASRTVFAHVVDQKLFRRRVLVYGAGSRAANLLQLRRASDQRGFQIVAFVPVPTEHRLVEDPRVDSSGADLITLARKYDADEIVIAMDDRRQSFPIRALLDCRFEGIDVVEILTFLERESGKVNVELMNPSWLIFAPGFARGFPHTIAFRVFDLVASLLVLLASWPVMLLTALAVLIEDGSPVLYRQTRVGVDGREFELLKFRSMSKNAELGTGAQWAQKNDSRVTKVGAFIRKLRFDELPQLFNILRGDMRFVGPRPERPEFVEALSKKIPYYNERHCVKPGLTGWAQLWYPYGSSEKDALEKLKFDLYYVKNQSLILDMMILIQTVEVVLWRKGAR